MNNRVTSKNSCAAGGARAPRSPVRLCDGRYGLRSTMPVEVCSPAPVRAAEPGANAAQPGMDATPAGSSGKTPSLDPQPILDFIASDATLDRTGEIIAPPGWRLEAYRRNPVFQNSHQYGDIIFTLGKALITEVRSTPLSALPSPFSGPYLFQRIEFAVEANPMARIAYALYQGKFLNAVSVGFIPLKWEELDGTNGADGTNERRRYLEQELVEVSAVGIPANPNALALGVKSGLIEKADLRELADLLRRALDASGDKADSRSARPTHFCSNPAVPNTHACAAGVRSNEAHLLQLARAIRNVLRQR